MLTFQEEGEAHADNFGFMACRPTCGLFPTLRLFPDKGLSGSDASEQTFNDEGQKSASGTRGLVSSKVVSGQSINFEKQFRNHKSVYRYFQRAGFTPTVAGRLSGRTERQAGYDGWGNRENIQGMMGTNP